MVRKIPWVMRKERDTRATRENILYLSVVVVFVIVDVAVAVVVATIIGHSFR